MKLLFCRRCHDVFKLARETRCCSCGLTKGWYRTYEDESLMLDAEYSGEYAVPIGFSNKSLTEALRNIPKSGQGFRFEAFVIPKECDTFRSVDGKKNTRNYV